MKVKLTYWEETCEEVEITAEDYCQLHANSSYKDYFPRKSFNRKIEFDENKSFEELEQFYSSQNS